MKDSQYQNLHFQLSELKHNYGPRVHLLADPYLLLGLSTLSSAECRQPQVHYWVSRLYRSLLQNAINSVFAKTQIVCDTRMKSYHAEGALEFEGPHPQSKVVVVNLARAGTVPSFVCYDELNYFFKPEGIRQDHLILNREVDATGKVTGCVINGSKIGGDIEGAYVLVPDPMGATGSTLIKAHEAYAARGRATRWIALHLIVTPEYLRAVTQACPEVEIFALRLDRGLSSSEILNSGLGQYWDQEKGLNERQYIVPGAGGLGEILNNTLS